MKIIFRQVVHIKLTILIFKDVLYVLLLTTITAPVKRRIAYVDVCVAEVNIMLKHSNVLTGEI